MSKIVHSNNGLFGGYHYRVVKDFTQQKQVVFKIQEIQEGTERRYKTIATIPATQYRADVWGYDLTDPGALYRWAVTFNAKFN